MKIYHWAIIFILIIVPFSLVCRNVVNTKFNSLEDEVRLNNVIDSATQDAIDEIIEVANEFDTGKNVPLTPDLIESAIDSFFHTFAVNMNLPYIQAKNSSTRLELENYIPAIIVVGYDGFYVYSAEKTASNMYEYKLKPKIPYAYEDEFGNVINFTLGNDVTVYVNNDVVLNGEAPKVFTGKITDDKTANEIYAQYATLDLGSANVASQFNIITMTTDNASVILKFLKDKMSVSIDSFLTEANAVQDYEFDEHGNVLNEDEISKFHLKRRETIIACITEALEEEVIEHNSYANLMGVTYTFHIPAISGLEWNSTINDISFLAFVQGIPIGNGRSYYNNYSLGGSRLVRTQYIYATSDGYYHRAVCYDKDGNIYNTNTRTDLAEIYINAAEAAKKGFYPCTTCKP